MTPHPEVRATRAWEGERGGHPEQAARNPSAHPGRGGGGGPPRTAACAPRARHAGEGEGGKSGPRGGRGAPRSSVRFQRTAYS